MTKFSGPVGAWFPFPDGTTPASEDTPETAAAGWATAATATAGCGVTAASVGPADAGTGSAGFADAVMDPTTPVWGSDQAMSGCGL